MNAPLGGLKTLYNLDTRAPYSSSSASLNVLIMAMIDFSPTILAKRALFVNKNLRKCCKQNGIG